MSILTRSLKRLYENRRVSAGKILSMNADGKITDEERDYILYG